MQQLTFTERIIERCFTSIRDRRNVLERRLLTDDLTKLGNRAAFSKIEAQAVKNNQTFILFDANNFGRINKQCGHRRGDEVLQKLAKVLAEVTKHYKVQAFRYGGDEFVIVCAHRFAAKVRDEVERRFRPIDFGNFVVTISGEIGSSIEDADGKLQARKTERKRCRKL
jgi:diguanylate cyclase (GGDEF)-like protein